MPCFGAFGISVIIGDLISIKERPAIRSKRRKFFSTSLALHLVCLKSTSRNNCIKSNRSFM
nr:MAG TPA: hypothetical protein [Caudoviricetes sp.]